LKKKAQKKFKTPKFNKDLPLISYNMITELDTDEELSQTSNLTQDNDLTFELTSGSLTNSTQTQPSTIIHKDNTT
ncbi:3806_t:CDS:1, partial [Paraglomus occultum]